MMRKKNKKKSRKYLFWAVGAVATAATLATIKQKIRPTTTFTREEKKLTSKRLTDIYCTINIPNTNKAMPLMIFVHGFGADRHEGGRFTAVADALAKKGIASIRMDLPGCNESKESFELFAIRNILDDVITCYDHMVSSYDIDQDHMGIVGYSMGGRVATLYSRINPKIHTMILWAPALTYKMEGLEDFMGGKEELKLMIKKANKENAVVYHDPFGNDKMISKEYFTDMESYDVLQALNQYKHDLLIVMGNKDDIVKPEVIDKALTFINKDCHFNYIYMDHANHGFGLWDNHPEQSEKLVNSTIKFIERRL